MSRNSGSDGSNHRLAVFLAHLREGYTPDSPAQQVAALALRLAGYLVKRGDRWHTTQEGDLFIEKHLKEPV